MAIAGYLGEFPNATVVALGGGLTTPQFARQTGPTTPSTKREPPHGHPPPDPGGGPDASLSVPTDGTGRDDLGCGQPHRLWTTRGRAQTTYWRLGEPDVTWLSVDLAPVIELRAELLPPAPRVRSLAMSALDRAWLDEVDPSDGVFVCAEGLFMYLERAEVVALITDCAHRLPGGHSSSTRSTSLSVSQAARLPREIPGVTSSCEVALPFGRGVWGSRLLRRLANLPGVRDGRPSMTLLSFGRG